MAKLVFGNNFRRQYAFRHVRRRSQRNQRGIFHAAGVAAAVRWVNHGDAVVWIRAIPLLEKAQRAFLRVNVSLSRRHVSGRHQQVNFYGALAAGPGIFEDREAGASGPGKIVNVCGMIGEHFRAVGIICAGNEVTAGADDFVLRNGDLHVEGAEVREKFGVGVKLMAVPGVLPPDADFGEPLADHIEIVGVAGALDDLGKHIVKGDVELHGGAGRDWFWQRDLENRAVVLVAIVGMDEFHFVRKVAGAFDFQFIYRDRAKMFGIPVGIRAAAARSSEANFGHECGLRLEGVEVEMEGESLLRLSGEVFIREGFVGGDGVFGGVEFGLDLVGNYACGERFRC